MPFFYEAIEFAAWQLFAEATYKEGSRLQIAGSWNTSSTLPVTGRVLLVQLRITVLVIIT